MVKLNVYNLDGKEIEKMEVIFDLMTMHVLSSMTRVNQLGLVFSDQSSESSEGTSVSNLLLVRLQKLSNRSIFMKKMKIHT